MGTVGVGGAFTCGFDALDTTSIKEDDSDQGELLPGIID